MKLKRWQKYTEELYKKGLNDPDNHDGVVTHPEPDILDCEVKWVFGGTAANKASECDRILVRAIQNPKGRCYQCVALNMSANLEDPAVATGLEKSILIPIPKGSTTECANHWTIATHLPH